MEEGPITRSMARYLEAHEESEAPTQIKMLTTLSFEDHLEISKKSVGIFVLCKNKP